MKIATIIVTRGKSCHVKTLHSILRFNILCIQTGGDIQNEVVFTDEDPFEKSDTIHRFLKTHDRIFFIDFGIHVDDNSMKRVIDNNDGYGVVVFPGVKEGINWNMFKEKIRAESTEPTEQMGLDFDTEVSTKVVDDIYHVKSTAAKSWVLMCKPVLKQIKDKRSGTFKIHPKLDVMFSKFKEHGVKLVAFTAAQLVQTYSHECIGNIVNSSGVKAT
jgi:hypothetical protein